MKTKILLAVLTVVVCGTLSLFLSKKAMFRESSLLLAKQNIEALTGGESSQDIECSNMGDFLQCYPAKNRFFSWNGCKFNEGTNCVIRQSYQGNISIITIDE